MIKKKKKIGKALKLDEKKSVSPVRSIILIWHKPKSYWEKVDIEEIEVIGKIENALKTGQREICLLFLVYNTDFFFHQECSDIYWLSTWEPQM